MYQYVRLYIIKKMMMWWVGGGASRPSHRAIDTLAACLGGGEGRGKGDGGEEGGGWRGRGGRGGRGTGPLPMVTARSHTSGGVYLVRGMRGK